MAKSVTEYFKVDFFNSNSAALFEGDFRLNAEYYTHENSFSLPKGTITEKLSELADVFGFGPFKRHYIENPKYGIPLISSSEMMELTPSYEGIISTELTRGIEKYIVEKDTILVSCSGTIGKITLVDSRLEGKALSQHALRIKARNKNYIGLIYTFLNSEYGQSVVTGKKSGAVIDEIYEGDLKAIDIPIISDYNIKKLNTLVLDAFLKRETANKYLENAEHLIHKYNNLPALSEAIINTIDQNNEVQIDLISLNDVATGFRLDAHFYNPVAKLAVHNIMKLAKRNESLFSIADCSFRGSRSIRNYVDEKHGLPFLSGKNIIQIRPDFKFISKSETSNLGEMLIEKNWILISRSGTLGRTVFVWNNYENFAASEHLIRVVPNEDVVDAGYLYAFLSSDYGYHQLLRCKHGSVIDEITEDQIGESIVPLPSDKQQKQIGDLVRQAYDLRSEAISLEDEAQEILKKGLNKK